MCQISIVIPVYNAEKYLDTCINSILSQNLQDFEIICIENGSTDNSRKILEKYKDKRIKIIYEKNIGPGKARNIGIKCAKGDYIGFVDSDDYVDKDMFEKLYNQAIRLNSDVVVCNRKIFYKNHIKLKNDWKIIKSDYTKLKKTNIKTIPTEQNFSGFDIKPTLLVTFPFCWNKIYRRTYLIQNNISFSNTFLSEDCIFILKAFLFTEKISYINEHLYNYRENPCSLTHTQSKHAMDEFTVIKEITGFLEQSGYDKTLETNLNFYRLFALCSKYEIIPTELKKEYINKVQATLSKSDFAVFLRKNHLRIKFIIWHLLKQL